MTIHVGFATSDAPTAVVVKELPRTFVADGNLLDLVRPYSPIVGPPAPPFLTALLPATVAKGTPTLITVTGGGFTGATLVYVNSMAVATTFVNSTTVTYTEAGSAVATPPGTLAVAVRTGLQESNTLTLDVTGPAFNPLTLITWKSAAWASDPAWPPPADGAPITTWRDGGTEAKDLFGVGTPPLYRAAYAPLNGKPAVDFDGSTGALRSAQYGTSKATPYSVVLVARSEVVGVNSYLCSWGTGGLFTDAALYKVFNGVAVASSTLTADTTKHLLHAAIGGATTIGRDGVESSAGFAGGAQAVATFLASYSDNSAKADVAIAFFGLFEGDITTHAKWAELKAGFATFYGITVA